MNELKEQAIAALEGDGWVLQKSPNHHGLAMAYTATKNDEKKLVVIRTTKNGDDGISFVPYSDGQHWKTLLDDDHHDKPDQIVVISGNDTSKIHIFDGHEVREMYLEAYKSRVDGGRKPQDGRGFWIPLREFPPQTKELPAGKIVDLKNNSEKLPDIVTQAREMVAEAAGVAVEQVSITVDWTG